LPRLAQTSGYATASKVFIDKTVCMRQWRTQKISDGGKVSLQSCDVTNQL